MPAPLRNRFAAKPQDEQHSERLYVRLKKQEKDRIVEATGETGIAAWARGVLLSAAASKAVRAATRRSSEREPAVWVRALFERQRRRAPVADLCVSHRI